MKIHSIIPRDKRQNYRCHFCGETRSVKYITEIMDPVIDSKPTKVCCCNKCILIGDTRQMPDYHCNWCGHDFSVEEGYNGDIDDIVCPNCKAVKGDFDYFIQEV